MPAGRATALALALALAALPAAAQREREPPREVPRRELPGPPDGELIEIPRRLPTELLELPAELVDGLLDTAIGETVEIAEWPLRPRERAPVVLTRHDVYADGADLWVVRGARRQALPRSTWVFLWGAARDLSRVRVTVAVDPATRHVLAMAFTPDGTFELRRSPQAARPGPSDYLLGPQHLVRGLVGDEADRWICGQAEVPDTLTVEALIGAATHGVTAEAISTQHTATVAVDTDTQFLAKFGGNTQAASNFVASLFAQVNTIYQRDLLVRLVQGTTYLRAGSDPWTVGDTPPYSDADNWQKLQELTNWWSANQAGVSRALVLMLSGRGGAGAAGIAWVDALCSKSHGYAFARPTTTGTTPLASDVLITAHEIGHVFGSPHTHCYNTLGLPNPDNCLRGETFAGKACFNGTPQCPAPAVYQGVTARGTLMSYCHLLGGCSAEQVFHPTSIALLAPKIEARTPPAAGSAACILPDTGPAPPDLAVSAVSPSSGSTAGGTVVTITGSGFHSGVVVTFGGVRATAVTVHSSTRLTVVAPPHAAGKVAVVVTDPGGAQASLSPGFFYQAPPPATAFYTVPPCRVVDTRNAQGPRGGPNLAPRQVRSFPVTGACGIPASARAVAANVTAAFPSASGFLGVYPGDAFPLGTSNVAFGAGVARATFSVLTLATDGSGSVLVLNDSAGTTPVVIDVSGYFR